MKTIIYSKYSNDRSPEYRIRTDILEDDQKKRYVCKRSIGEKSKSHIDRMYQNFLEMQKQFSTTRFRLNELTPTDQGAEFEYLTGPTLEEILDGYFQRQEYSELLTTVKNYADELRRAADSDFYPTPEFSALFGDTKLNEPYKSMRVSDIDIIFKNIIVTDQTWNIIDYEWSYSFPIPVDFILYRSMHYYLAGPREAVLNRQFHLFSEVGISESMCRRFAEMEESFQRYLLQGSRPLWMLRDDIGRMRHFPNESIEHNKLIWLCRQVRIEQNGQNQSVTGCEITPKPDDRGHVSFEIRLEPDAYVVKLMPARQSCMITIRDITGSNGQPIPYETNGFSLNEDTLYFPTITPQIILSGIPPKTDKLTVQWDIEYLSRESFLQKDMDIQSLSDTDSRLDTILSEYQTYKNLYENVINSTSWKFTRPLRKLTSFLKK